MKNLLTIAAVLLIASLSSTFAQDLSVKVNDPPIPYNGNVEWGNDLLVSASEPLGKHSGVYRSSNSTIYVSVPDTNIQSGAALVILTSTNNGSTWSNISAITPASVISKTKIIIGSTDSVYCFFISGATVYCWNVLNNRVTQVRGPSFRDFDVATSSTGSMYIFMDSLGTNNIVRYSSSNGGVVWGVRGLVTSGGANPKIYFSALGDTLILNYYGGVLADTATSTIRGARYRESVPGTMAVVGSFIDVTRSIAPKAEFKSVRHGTSAWFIYTSEEAGDVNIKCKVSNNGGNTFVDSAVIASLPTADEYWFDAVHHNRDGGGIDVIYFSSTGTNRGNTNQMNYITAFKSNMLSFSNAVQFADNQPVTSTVGYTPVLIPYYNSLGDAGAVWVGETGTGRGLYFDKLSPSVLNLTVSLEACSPPQDTVTVLLRSAVSPYAVVETKKVSLSGAGTASVVFTGAVNGVSYYIVVKHRNSVETWSKTGGEVFVNGILNYDFTTAASQAFGNNMVLVGSDYAFYSGDVNDDGFVDGADGLLIDNDAFNFVSGYVVTDLNCDGTVDGSDAVFADNNAFAFIGIVRP